MAFFRELWADKVLQAMIRAMQETQCVANSIMDYTPFTLGKKAAGYNGPTLSGLTVRALPANGSDDPSRDAVEISFNQKKGCVFTLSDIDVAQSDVDQLQELTEQASEALIDDYDAYITGVMVAGLSATAGFKNTISDTTGHQITRADFVDARKKLNQQKAPRRYRYCAIHPDLEAGLFDIPDFVSRDKIADTNAMRDGVIGRCLGFDIIVNADIPKVTSGWATANGTLPIALFYSKAAMGWGRQREFDAKASPDAHIPGDVINIYSVYGATVQKANYMVAYRKDVA
ncbi:MAG: P22 phage major capsid protein family protein [Candidatus Cloacimonetes bacterium]|nr:P22 phage major capsid protein family protein [Candidatus Cloacimonadota bacterium]